VESEKEKQRELAIKDVKCGDEEKIQLLLLKKQCCFV